ncbi:MGDG synthase family glycosyltransferase [Clostridium fallax]|uniref:Processive 1,2-diacylglycerol beta-glucosyltransferase n=1 Tax=Clostridium fallax TaxID=1533 RepID=A0A1M4WIL4_9CLOT|nr:glycosyltransferase [Clostridium fallax]SHE81066.1 processive 1,2-diacylglycerol beta-glucosyltransferase [Clostridium fallax]SQB05727.1 monogalactosyldiacylglycerol synthase [Clostridium fallax]
MKKVLLLTTSTGQGHNQAANSLSEIFTKENFKVIKYDFLYNTSPFWNSLIVKGYEFSAAKIPKLFGIFYKITDNKFTNKSLKFNFWGIEKKLLDYINKEKPDLIIATHPLSINIIGRLKEKGLINIPFISIVTDFVAHGTYLCDYVDAYVAGSSITKESLCNRGIPENKVFIFGIPIKSEFYKKSDDLKLPKDDYFNILLMSGSMGIAKISYVLKELLKNRHNLRITVICGRNQQLKENLLKLYSKPIDGKKIHIIGYTNDVCTIMDNSDILISKPGGLTSTEAITKNIPLIIPFVIPGQESQNTEFLTNAGLAIYIDNLKTLNENVNNLIENPDLMSNMKLNLTNLSKQYSLQKIVDLSNELINKKG